MTAPRVYRSQVNFLPLRIGQVICAVGGIDFNNLTGFVNESRVLGAQFKAIF